MCRWMPSSFINKSLLYLTFITSPPRLHKNHELTFSPIFLPCHKKPIHPTWLSQNPTKINSFCNKTFHTSFGCICDNSPQWLLKNHDIIYSPILLIRNKNPIHPTCLSQNPTKINSFCTQTFDTSFWMHLWQFPTKIAQKPWLHLLTNFASKAQKANLPNLAQPKHNKDQFLFATKLFTPHFGCIYDNFPPRLLKNHDFTSSPILLPRHKN